MRMTEQLTLLMASEDTLAKRIARERERRQWTQDKLAKEVSRVLGGSFPQSAVSKIERPLNRRSVSAQELIAFGQVFEIDPLSLMLPDAEFDLEQAAVAFENLEVALADAEAKLMAAERARVEMTAAGLALSLQLALLEDVAREAVVEGLARRHGDRKVRHIFDEVGRVDQPLPGNLPAHMRAALTSKRYREQLAKEGDEQNLERGVDVDVESDAALDDSGTEA